jgi:S1-C subfamily serine protease
MNLDYQGREYPVSSQGIRIGRGTDNDIVLVDDQTSRHHATVLELGGRLSIRDEHSTNGTFVNGARIAAPTPLHPGDRIQIGRAQITVRVGAGRAAAEVASSPAHSTSSACIIVTGVIAVALVVFLLGGIALAVIFSTPASPTAIAQATLTKPVVGLTHSRQPTTGTVATATPIPSATAMPVSPTPMPTVDTVRRALMAIVDIAVPVEGTKSMITGSGSILDSRGYILTNFHVVRDSKTQKLYNSQDRIYVAVVTDPSKPPDRVFRADAVGLDPTLDLALLKLSGLENGQPLPTNLDLTVVPMGNSDSVRIGDQIQVIGFPGVGGNTLTLSRGIVSGFLSEPTWIKTDTEINPGNSGGMAINLAGELIGVPTRVVSDPTISGKLGLIRPINLAKPLISQIR